MDYGDGTPVTPLALTGKSFALTHDYAAPGQYMVTVTVTDDDGGVGTATVAAHNCTPPPEYDRYWMGGAAEGPTAWEVAANWNPVGVPATFERVFVCGSVEDSPVLSDGATVGGLLVAAGATLNVDEFTLTVSGDVDGRILGGELGVVRMIGDEATLVGEAPSVFMDGAVTLVGTTTIANELLVLPNGRLTIGGRALTRSRGCWRPARWCCSIRRAGRCVGVV